MERLAHSRSSQRQDTKDDHNGVAGHRDHGPAVTENPKDSEYDELEEKITSEDPSDEEETSTDHHSPKNGNTATRHDFPNARLVRHLARNPYLYSMSALAFTLSCSVFGMIYGSFSITADMKGWWSRGTDIAKMQTQIMILTRNEWLIRDDDPSSWDAVLTQVQPGIDAVLSDYDDDRRRRLQFRYGPSNCNNMEWYTSGNFYWQGNTLWPVWRTRSPDISALEPAVIRDICEAEENAKRFLEDNGYCGGCSGDNTLCLPPLSLVYFARLSVYDYGFELPCDKLTDAWTEVSTAVTNELVQCVNDIRSSLTSAIVQRDLPQSCPLGFSPFMVDDSFGVDGNTRVRITSSVFSTALSGRSINGLYKLSGNLDTAESSKVVSGVYDTLYEHFYELAVDDAIRMDMVLAIAAVVVTVLAMIIHTRSPFITLAGLVQILVSFPFAYFVYTVVCQLEFFPFLNFLGVYVVFAIGADDVFVAVDKWKNARLEHARASTEDIASLALPDAAVSMFLTTSTTVIAFFGTAICPVASLKMFAIFMGLLILLDYVLCIMFVFPALCLYDRWKQRREQPGWFVECCRKVQTEEDQESLIRRILSAYYSALHFLRYPLLIFIAASFGVSAYYAIQLDLPGTSGVRLLNSNNNLEQQFQWRLQLFGNELLREIGSIVQTVWGIIPSDTGDHKNPDESSVLVLDDHFDPSSEAAQLHLLNFCDELFGQPFINRDFASYDCPMNLFDSWLEEQAEANLTDSALVEHMETCGNSTGIPVDPTLFHSCFLLFKSSASANSWNVRQSLEGVLSRDGIIRTIRIPFKQAGVRWDNGYSEMDEAWNKLQRVVNSQNDIAPDGVDGAFAASFDYWWYDTNGSLLSTAIGAIFIALGAAFVVLLGSSRSLVITTFAVFTIAYILVSVTALLVVSGWTLGFLEAVCFAILIGISCDFVLHFGHAYCSPQGSMSNHERTKRALLLMGPSILAAAVTTIAAAVVMRFAQIVFFRRFATILIYSLAMGLFGSMLVFLTLTDVLGPAEPTASADYLTRGCFGNQKHNSKEAPRPTAESLPPERTYMGKFIGYHESYA